ncbi:MAG: MarR family transcriptional regulator [Anaeroplasmataceae bacterium]|nr:MarR family transcriptional regulator [Anaeroplasmataceae bacterium]MDE5867474.1 MarR family transcriptional regulator [Anaeroplasmataceae bacterium]
MNVVDLTRKIKLIQNNAFSRMDRKIEEVGLTRIEFHLLSHIYVSQSIQASALASFFQVSIPAVMHKLDSLEKKGFVLKQVDERDKRVKYYSITESFKEYYHALFSNLEELTQAYFDFLGEEMKHLDIILDKTLEFLEDRND